MKIRSIGAFCSVFTLICIITLTFSSCFFFGRDESEPEPTDSLLTTPYGDVIPTYDDVDRTSLDPSLFMKDLNGRYYYADASVPTFTGIDISAYQDEVDWDAVKNDGIDFVMLRVGYRGYGNEGKLGEDDMFLSHYENALAVGLKVGVYFFSQATSPDEAREEAYFVLDRIRGLQITYPVAYDWEVIDYDKARTDNMTTDEISDCAVAFCDVVASSGYDVLVYFNRELGYFNYDLSKVSNYHFWLAEYNEAPTFVYDYKIWQYTENGSVAGIDGTTDINICVHDYAAGK